MKRWLTGFSMCWGMFCAIPNPLPRWDKACYRQMLLCLPILGALLGGIWAGVGYVLARIGAPRLVFAACMAVCPWCLTGFIHLDGFMDCSDAVLSRREQARRQEILEDSHVGSFAVIAMVLLALFSFVFWSEGVLHGKLWGLPMLCTSVRAVSAWAVLCLAPLASSGYSTMEKKKSAAWGAACMALVCSMLGLLLPGWSALAPFSAVCAAGGMILALRRNLGGMSGDISGAAITVGELVGAAILLLL